MKVTSELIAILRDVSLFSSLSDAALARLVADLEEVNAAAGTPIFRKGDHSRSLYIVISGSVRIHDGDLTFTYRENGDFFGEMGALHAEVRTASATAERDTRLLRLDQKRLHRLMDEHGEIALGIIDVLCYRLSDTSRNLSEDFEYIRQVGQLTAAAQSLETGEYHPVLLEEVAKREDALGGLARVFRTMADEVQAREERLRQEVQSLRIEVDRVKQAQEVRNITDSDYFRSLQQQVQNLRSRSRSTGTQE